MEKRYKSMWDEVEAMADAQAKASALADPDSRPTDAMFWADADMQKPYRLAMRDQEALAAALAEERVSEPTKHVTDAVNEYRNRVASK